MLLVTNSVQLVQRMPYQGLHNRMTNHSHCEISRWSCVTFEGRKGATKHD